MTVEHHLDRLRAMMEKKAELYHRAMISVLRKTAGNFSNYLKAELGGYESFVDEFINNYLLTTMISRGGIKIRTRFKEGPQRKRVRRELAARAHSVGFRRKTVPSFRDISSQITGPEGPLSEAELTLMDQDVEISFRWLASSTLQAMNRPEGQRAITAALRATEEDFMTHMGPEFEHDMRIEFAKWEGAY